MSAGGHGHKLFEPASRATREAFPIWTRSHEPMIQKALEDRQES